MKTMMIASIHTIRAVSLVDVLKSCPYCSVCEILILVNVICAAVSLFEWESRGCCGSID